MKQLIKLTNINQDYKGEKILTNINLTFNQMQNTVIYADDNQINSCHLLLDILTKTAVPQRGEVEFFDDKSNKFFIGYNLFDEILDKDIIVVNVLKALTTNYNLPKNESDELLKLLTIDGFVNKSTLELSAQERHLLNAYLLLLIRPQIIVLKSLSIPGSEFMQKAALEYIKNYLTKFKMTLIISTNDKVTIDTLCERGINLSNAVVESDVLIVQQSQVLSNQVNNKPRPYNFAENLLDTIYKLEDKKEIDESRKQEKQFVEKLLTKSLQNAEPVPTKALDDELESIISEKRSMNNMDIQNNSNIQANITKTVKVMINDSNIDIDQIIECYHQRKQLQDEIESSDFVNLTVDLQSKVYENYNRTNAMINKYDPTNKYDPYYKPNLDASLNQERMDKAVHAKKAGITKMIFDENLDIDTLDINDNVAPNINKTKQINMDNMMNYDTVKTKSYNTDELTKKIVSASDIEYMPEETKKKFWFKKKPVESDSMKYVSNAGNPYEDNLTNEFLAKSKKQGPARVVKTEKFEPTKKLLNIEPTDFNDVSMPELENLSPAEKKKKLIELKIKKRSKLNALEELYYEALEEKENILKDDKY